MYTKDEHIVQLEATIEALMNRLSKLQREKNKRNDEQALKWRNSCFYYKKKSLFLEEYIKIMGKPVPVYEN